MDDLGSAPLTRPIREWVSGLDRGVLWTARHWLALFNLVVFVYVGLPFAAPVLMAAGMETPARGIYLMYRNLCHQFAFRSWFLFGEQPVYPRAAAGTEWESFQAATGIDERDIAAARAFVGNDQVGYKVAFCQRDVAIYGGILLAGLAYAGLRLRFKIRPLPWYLWLFLGLGPIALDGFSQLLTQPPYDLLPGFRESTPFLRTLTGGLFGAMNVWLAYPHLQASMQESAQVLEAKAARIAAQDRSHHGARGQP